ncbi:hypothetical protein OSTOST_12030 [Ostertagia ostertagi]
MCCFLLCYSSFTIPQVPAAPGIHGGSQSHEYHLKNPLDEDGIHFCSSCGSGSKREDGPHVCECGDPTAVSTFSTVEVAHTFQLDFSAVSSLIPEGEERICLPSVIAPFSAAVVVTKQLLHNVITELTLSSLDRLLKGGVLLDDRVEENVGKRIKSLQEIGIPRIIVLGKTTQDTINKIPKLEFIAPPQQNFQHPWESRELSLNELMQAIG